MNEKYIEYAGSCHSGIEIGEDLPQHLLEQTSEVIGCAMEVLNVLGHGLLEKPYEEALVVEFELRRIPYRQQPRCDVIYKNALVGYFVPDLIAYENIVVDTKSVDRIGPPEVGQMLNYLRITGLGVGVLLNFSKPRLEWRRVAL